MHIPWGILSQVFDIESIIGIRLEIIYTLRTLLLPSLQFAKLSSWRSIFQAFDNRSVVWRTAVTVTTDHRNTAVLYLSLFLFPFLPFPVVYLINELYDKKLALLLLQSKSQYLREIWQYMT